jgi:AcrR family transcriptional regulator
MLNKVKLLERRQNLRDALILAAEKTVAKEGVHSLRARPLADSVGCAVGMIYKAFADLDELILAVNERTLDTLGEVLEMAGQRRDKRPEDAIECLSQLALAYLDFAAETGPRWRALFEHRMENERPAPEWYAEKRRQMFRHVEAPLKTLLPELTGPRRGHLARTLFSAVHGVVVLGLEEKLGSLPLPLLRQQLRTIVRAAGRGLSEGR